MPVEPGDKGRLVFFPALPTVTRPLLDDQLRRHARVFELGDDQFRLLNRHDFISIAVHDQRRRISRRDVVDRRNFPADGQDAAPRR